MEQKDYFERQLSQFGKALTSVLASLMNKKHDGGLKIEDVQRVLNELAALEVLELFSLDCEDFAIALDKKASNNHEIQLLSQILFESWNIKRDDDSLRCKTLHVHLLLKEMSSDYDFELASRINELQSVQNS